MAFNYAGLLPVAPVPVDPSATVFSWEDAVKWYWKLDKIRFDFTVTMPAAGTADHFVAFGKTESDIDFVETAGAWAPGLLSPLAEDRAIAPSGDLAARWEYLTDTPAVYAECQPEARFYIHAGIPSLDFGFTCTWTDNVTGESFILVVSIGNSLTVPFTLDGVDFSYDFSGSEAGVILDDFTPSITFNP